MAPISTSSGCSMANATARAPRTRGAGRCGEAPGVRRRGRFPAAGPRPCGVGAGVRRRAWLQTPRRAHAPSPVLNEEQHVQAAEQHGINVEEISCKDRLGLGFQERPPGLPGPSVRGVDAGILEDLPHGRRRQLVAQADQLAVDAPVPPARVVPGHLQHQRPDGLGCPGRPRAQRRWVQRRRMRSACQRSRVRGETIRRSWRSWLPGSSRASGQHRAVCPGQSLGLDLPLEHGDLVAQDQDLGVLGAVRAGEQGKPAEHAQYCEVGESHRHEY